MKIQKQKATGIVATDDPASSGYHTTGGSAAMQIPIWDYPGAMKDRGGWKEEDVVNHPNHYAPNGVDSFMHMKDQMGKAAFDGFLQGNVIKYVQRYKFKGKPVEDLCKAAFYLFHLAFEAADEAGRPGLYDRLAETLHHAADHFTLGGGS